MVKPNEIKIGQKVWYDHPSRGLEEVVVDDGLMKNIIYDSMMEIDNVVAGRTYLEKPKESRLK